VEEGSWRGFTSVISIKYLSAASELLSNSYSRVFFSRLHSSVRLLPPIIHDQWRQASAEPRWPRSVVYQRGPRISPAHIPRSLPTLHPISPCNCSAHCAHFTMTTREEYALSGTSEASESPSKRLRIEATEKSFRCQICNRMYERADHLNRHLDSREYIS
jgi:hypothetical protein